VLTQLLELIHPLMPFVTEEIWSKIPGHQGFIMTQTYPGAEDPAIDRAAEEQIGFLMDITKSVRSARADFGVPPGDLLSPLVKTGEPALLSVLTEYSPLLLRLMGGDSLKPADPQAVKPREAAFSVFPWGEVWVPLAGHIDLPKEKVKLQKEAGQLEKDIQQATQKLANPGYLRKAPTEVVEETRERLKGLEKRLEAVRRSLEKLSEMTE
jgi:valyl-tRNA synthetase